MIFLKIQEKIESISGKFPEGWPEMITKIVNRDIRCRPNLQNFLGVNLTNYSLTREVYFLE